MKVVKAKVTRVFRSNLNSEKTIIVNEGGTRSGKSYAITQLFIYKSHTEWNKKFLITRKFSRTLFYSTYNLFVELMRKYGLFEEERLNKTQKVYTTPTNSVIYFLGVDDFEKLKSTEFNYIFIEEATEFDFEDFIVLYNHLSAPSEDGQKNKLYLAFNPDYPPTHWIATELPKFDTEWIKSNFYDNPFLDAETRSRIESLKYIDETLYLIYGLGQRAEVKELVFPAFEIVDEPEGNLIAYGLDWGYNNPTAIVAVYVGDDFWCADELFYRSFATIEEIHYFITENLKPKTKIYADPSRPELINYLRNKGVYIEPAKTDVLMSIELIKMKKLKVTKTSVNLIKELRSYKWKKKGEQILDEPVKVFDHAIDALRYATYSSWRNNEVAMPVIVEIRKTQKSLWR